MTLGMILRSRGLWAHIGERIKSLHQRLVAPSRRTMKRSSLTPWGEATLPRCCPCSFWGWTRVCEQARRGRSHTKISS
jgi:hypothetical protein